MREFEFSSFQRSQQKEKRRLDMHHQLATFNNSLLDKKNINFSSTMVMEMNNRTLNNSILTPANKWIFDLWNTTE